MFIRGWRANRRSRERKLFELAAEASKVLGGK
jgi:hypothetical protein